MHLAWGADCDQSAAFFMESLGLRFFIEDRLSPQVPEPAGNIAGGDPRKQTLPLKKTYNSRPAPQDSIFGEHHTH